MGIQNQRELVVHPTHFNLWFNWWPQLHELLRFKWGSLQYVQNYISILTHHSSIKTTCGHWTAGVYLGNFCICPYDCNMNLRLSNTKYIILRLSRLWSNSCTTAKWVLLMKEYCTSVYVLCKYKQHRNLAEMLKICQ